MRFGWALVLGVAGGIAVAWWLSREPEAQQRERRARAEASAAAASEASRPVLYRWRDDDGALHVTDTAPKGRRYERVPIEPDGAIEVHGDRLTGPR